MSESGRDAEADTTVTVEIDQDELYTAIRTGTKDALLDVFATVVLLGLALFAILLGVQALLGAPSAVWMGFGVGAIVVGFAIAAAALELWPTS